MYRRLLSSGGGALDRGRRREVVHRLPRRRGRRRRGRRQAATTTIICDNLRRRLRRGRRSVRSSLRECRECRGRRRLSVRDPVFSFPFSVSGSRFQDPVFTFGVRVSGQVVAAGFEVVADAFWTVTGYEPFQTAGFHARTTCYSESTQNESQFSQMCGRIDFKSQFAFGNPNKNTSSSAE